MKKNTFVLILFIILGLMAGNIISHLLAQVSFLSFLLRSSDVSLNHSADLLGLTYDISFGIRLNIISLLTVATSIWMYRRM